MFQRNKRNDVLPSTAYGTGRDSGGGGLPFARGGGDSQDGSGRSIKMDAPVVKAWKRAAGYTRGSYYALGVTLFMVFYGFRSMRYWNASIWLTCHQQECTLEITPPGTRTMTVVFPREQLHSAEAIKTDEAGHFLILDKDKYEPPQKTKKKKKYKKTSGWANKGPDQHGRYRTYRLNLLRSPEDDNNNRRDMLEYADFSEVGDYVTKNLETGMYSLHFRHFSLSQSRMRVRSGVNKVESYVKRRRQKLLIKESANLPWQGILCLVFGLVGVLLTLLIGQFWEEAPRRQGGPGARRSHQKSSYRSTKNTRRKPSRPTSNSQYHKNY